MQAGLHLCCSQTPKTGFLALRPIWTLQSFWSCDLKHIVMFRLSHLMVGAICARRCVLEVEDCKARVFLLVDLRELFFRFRVGGTKKNK